MIVFFPQRHSIGQMGFDIGGSINSVAEWLTNAPIVHRIINSPVATAILITAIMATVAMSMFRGQVRNKKAIRAALYIFAAVLLVVFVHHYAIMHKACDTAHQQEVQDVFANIEVNRNMQRDSVPVIPQLVKGGQMYDRPHAVPAADIIGIRTPPRAMENVAPYGYAPGDLTVDDATLPYPNTKTVVAGRP